MAANAVVAEVVVLDPEPEGEDSSPAEADGAISLGESLQSLPGTSVFKSIPPTAGATTWRALLSEAAAVEEGEDAGAAGELERLPTHVIVVD